MSHSFNYIYSLRDYMSAVGWTLDVLKNVKSFQTSLRSWTQRSGVDSLLSVSSGHNTNTNWKLRAGKEGKHRRLYTKTFPSEKSLPTVPKPAAFAPSIRHRKSGYTSLPSRILPTSKVSLLKTTRNVRLTTSRSAALREGNMELGLFKQSCRVTAVRGVLLPGDSGTQWRW